MEKSIENNMCVQRFRTASDVRGGGYDGHPLRHLPLKRLKILFRRTRVHKLVHKLDWHVVD